MALWVNKQKNTEQCSALTWSQPRKTCWQQQWLPAWLLHLHQCPGYDSVLVLLFPLPLTFWWKLRKIVDSIIDPLVSYCKSEKEHIRCWNQDNRALFSLPVDHYFGEQHVLQSTRPLLTRREACGCFFEVWICCFHVLTFCHLHNACKKNFDATKLQTFECNCSLFIP